MAAVEELVGGAVLGAAVGELFQLARASIIKVAEFRAREVTLNRRLDPLEKRALKLHDCEGKCNALHLIEEGRALANECSKVSLLNLSNLKDCASKFTEMVGQISYTEVRISLLEALQQTEGPVRTTLCSPDPQEMEGNLLEYEEQLKVVLASEGSGKNMPLEEDGIDGGVVGGASLPEAVAELFQTVKNVIDEASRFKTQLKKLESTLDSVTPICKEIYLNWESHEMQELIETLNQGKDFVNQCSTVSQWNLTKRYRHAAELEELDRSILKYFQLVIHAQARRDTKEIGKKFETARIPTEAGRQEESEYSCAIV